MARSEYLEAAKQAITKVFSDTSVSRNDTREDLEELTELIQDYHASLDDSDNKHDYERP